jgi:hypothetical protein
MVEKSVAERHFVTIGVMGILAKNKNSTTTKNRSPMAKKTFLYRLNRCGRSRFIRCVNTIGWPHAMEARCSKRGFICKNSSVDITPQQLPSSSCSTLVSTKWSSISASPRAIRPLGPPHIRNAWYNRASTDIQASAVWLVPD